MRFIIAGSSGMIGKAISSFLEAKAYTVNRLVRTKDQLQQGSFFWDPEKSELDPEIFEGADGIINLAGENIASGRWTEKRKQKILESRLAATKTIRQTIEKTVNKPKVWLNASAIGYYGYERIGSIDEKSPPGSGFLAYVCRKWEEEALKGKDLGSRLVLPRIGVVLSKQGGMFKKMLFPFKMGMGGVIGTGNQPMSWIALDDLLEIFYMSLVDSTVTGPVNCVHPQVVSQKEFAKTLGIVLHRPTIFPMPAALVRFLFGEMGEELMLHGVKVDDAVLQQKGFQFKYPDLKSALQDNCK